MTAQVKVVGLKELRKALREAGDKDFANALRDANVKVAETVLEKARPGIAVESKSVAASGKPVKSQAGGKLAFTDARAGGVLFGAEHDKPRVGPSGRAFKGYNQFRAFDETGYHIAPEVDQNLEQIADVYMDAVDDYLDKQGVLRA